MSIEAMKMALEFVEANTYGGDDTHRLITALRQAIAEAEQAQPVATVSIEHFRGLKSMENVEFQLMTDMPVGSHLLYTAPPPRQPLTDEQEYEAIGTAGVDLLELAKQWADNEIHVYQFDNEARKIIKAVLRRAHGIKENT